MVNSVEDMIFVLCVCVTSISKNTYAQIFLNMMRRTKAAFTERVAENWDILGGVNLLSAWLPRGEHVPTPARQGSRPTCCYR